MDKVITINDWWDGPLLGLAYYHNVACIYERVFDEVKDEWSSEYYLKPINSDSQNEILNEWHEWCDTVSTDSLDDYYASRAKSNAIKNVIEGSKLKRKYRKKAIFSEQYGAGYIPVNYMVEWI